MQIQEYNWNNKKKNIKIQKYKYKFGHIYHFGCVALWASKKSRLSSQLYKELPVKMLNPKHQVILILNSN